MRVTAGMPGFLLLSVCLMAVCVFSSQAKAANTGPEYDRDEALSQSQAAVGELLGDFTFTGVSGQSFRVSALRGKPLVVSMIYTSCHNICPTITRTLQETVGIAREALGDDSFAVISVGFDWRIDTPGRMQVYGRQFGIEDPEWYFLSGDSASIKAITDNLGFQFYPSAMGFDHLSQTTVVDADGTIYRQIYGEKFEPPALVEPLKELVFDTPRSAGIVDHWLDTFKLFCTVYDPNTGRYAFDYSLFLGILIGVLCLGSIATFVAREWKHAR
jgi:protein SCO1